MGTQRSGAQHGAATSHGASNRGSMADVSQSQQQQHSGETEPGQNTGTQEEGCKWLEEEGRETGKQGNRETWELRNEVIVVSGST